MQQNKGGEEENPNCQVPDESFKKKIEKGQRGRGKLPKRNVNGEEGGV